MWLITPWHLEQFRIKLVLDVMTVDLWNWLCEKLKNELASHDGSTNFDSLFPLSSVWIIIYMNDAGMTLVVHHSSLFTLSHKNWCSLMHWDQSLFTCLILRWGAHTLGLGQSFSHRLVCWKIYQLILPLFLPVMLSVSSRGHCSSTNLWLPGFVFQPCWVSLSEWCFPCSLSHHTYSVTVW